jgi:ketosteroid isomerase-like protein
MTSNASRATTLVRTLRAAVARDLDELAGLLTDDVRTWTPAISTSSRAELIEAIGQRDDTFSDVELDVVPLDVGGDHACLEWTAAMTHTGPLPLHDDRSLEPTGIRVTLHGVTVAEFEGDRICALRQYWDDSDVLDQLGA